MALPAIAVAAGRALPKLAQGAGKFLRKGRGGGMPGAQAPEETEEDKKSGVFSTAGVMLGMGLILDMLRFISTILIVAFGVGLLLGRIVNGVGFAITTLWVLSRSGIQKGGKTTSLLMKFFKKQWKKLIIQAIPGIGDAAPFIWTSTIYSELTGKSPFGIDRLFKPFFPK